MNVYLWKVSIFSLVVEDVEEGLGGGRVVLLPHRGRRLAEQISRQHQGGHILRVGERGDGGVPGVDRVNHGPLPVRVLVHHRRQDLGQVISVSVSHVSPQNLVSPVTPEPGPDVTGGEVRQGLARHHAEHQVVLVPTEDALAALETEHTRPRQSREVRKVVDEQLLPEVGPDDDSVDAGSERAQVGGSAHFRLQKARQRHVPQAVYDVFVVPQEVLGDGAVDLARQRDGEVDGVFYQGPTAQG